MMGTAKYLSPEQVRGRKLDGRADLYSLGLVLYECLAGRVPFLGETDADTALARLNREATDLTRLRPTLPLGLAPLIHKLLERKPDLRYASGAEVRSELQRIAAQPKTDLDHSTDMPVQPAPTPRVTGNTPTVPAGQGQGGGTPRMPPPTPRSGTTGSQPALKGGRPAGSATRPDRTPPATVRPRQQPNRKYEQRTGPSMAFIGVLLAVAFVVALVLWVTMGTDGGTAPLDTGTTGGLGESTVAPTGAPVVGGSVLSVRTFDPDGNGQERDDLAPLAIDGNAETEWITVCYGDRYLGGKGGVGLVVDLGADRTGTLTVTLGSGPYQLRVYTALDGATPATFAEWGGPVKSANGTVPETVSVPITQPGRYVLVSFVELGTNNNCTNNPYRGSIRELTFG
jgi:serine/threonine-protein kinase